MARPDAAAIAGRSPGAREGFAHRVMRLTWPDWREAAQAAALLCRVAVRLRRGNFVALLDSFSLREAAPAASAARIARAQQLVRWAHRVVPLQPNCLLDSVAAAAWLRRSGVSAPLSIGVQMNQSLEAHAWLGDCPHSAANFRVLYRVPELADGWASTERPE